MLQYGTKRLNAEYEQTQKRNFLVKLFLDKKLGKVPKNGYHLYLLRFGIKIGWRKKNPPPPGRIGLSTFD